MFVLVACEESQVVCSAFRNLGHLAWSCDLQPESGGHPEWHIQGDCLPLLNGNCEFTTMDGTEHILCGCWDLVIAHPPCTYLSNAGARWLYKGSVLNIDRYLKGMAAREFFLSIMSCSAVSLCIENPLPSKIYNLPAPSQIIQPYQYGEPWSKRTLLWLRNLPLLEPTVFREDHIPYVSSGTYSRTHDKKYRGASRVGGSQISRSKTFPGIAAAMACQWSRLEKIDVV